MTRARRQSPSHAAAPPSRPLAPPGGAGEAPGASLFVALAHEEEDAVAAAEPQPSRRRPDKPRADPPVSPFFRDVHLGELGPAAQGRQRPAAVGAREALEAATLLPTRRASD